MGGPPKPLPRPRLLDPYGGGAVLAPLHASLVLSWPRRQLHISLLSPAGQTLLSLSIGLVLSALKPGSRSRRHSGGALASLGPVSRFLGRGLGQVDLALVFVGPARRALGVLGSLGGLGGRGAT